MKIKAHLITMDTLNLILLSVLQLMLLAGESSSEPLPTDPALLILHRHVRVHVVFEVGLLTEIFAAKLTFETAFICGQMLFLNFVVDAVCQIFLKHF